MTLRISKSKVCIAVIVALCVLAAFFTAVAVKPRAAFADEGSVFEIAVGDLADYSAVDDGDDEQEKTPNRLWLLQVGDGTVGLGDRIAYTVGAESGKTTVDGELYNSYVCYNGTAQTVVLNEDYVLNGKTLGEYFALENAEYTDNVATGELYKETKVTTAVRLYVDEEPTDGAEGDFAYDSEKEAWYIQLEKAWYIVSFNNAVRSYDGAEAVVDGWSYGDDVSARMPLRPEHGDVAVFEIGNIAQGENGEAQNVVAARFAVKYGATVSYFDTKLQDGSYVIDESKPLADDYYAAALAKLDAGNHTITVGLPEYTADNASLNWWDNGIGETDGAVYCAATYAFGFMVDPYVLPRDLDEDNEDITIEIVDATVPFNGNKDNVPDALVKFRGNTLVSGVDYLLTSRDVNAGDASFDFVGYGNFDGTIARAGEYKIVQGVNSWKSLPNIMQWTYGNYDKEVNLITAEPTYDYKSNSGLWFCITTDKLGMNYASPALAEIRLDDGYVSDSVAAALSRLSVGTYYLSATVDEHGNYYELSARGLEFRVFKGVNAWEATPSVKTWTDGEYTAENIPTAKSLFGVALVTVKDSDGNIVYNSVNATNTLAAAKAGTYTLTAYVLGTDDYTGMDLYTVVFQVFEKPGMPLWGVLLIIFGALLVVAIVILILWKKGVFQILTDKIVVSISTKAAMDATIAAVRANKKNEEIKQRAAAERRKEARRVANQKKKEMPLEQQAAALEEKAKKAAERAEKMKARSEAIQLRAERMKERAEQQAAEIEKAAAEAEQAEKAPEAEAPATENPKTENPVTEAPKAEQPKVETPEAEQSKAETPEAEAAATDDK